MPPLPRRSLPWVAAAVAVTVPLAASLPALADDTPPAVVSAFTPTPCWPGIPADIVTAMRVRCGTVAAPLRHERPDAGTVQLAVAVVPATGATPRPDPVVVLTGGPGQPGTAFLSRVLSPDRAAEGVGALRADRDLIFFDQRGTGYSRPSLSCQPHLGDTPLDEGLAVCRAALAKSTDLSAYTTAQNSADIDEIRRSLGYEQVNLYGVSYGSKLGYQTLRGTPPWVRAAVLASPIPGRPDYLLNSPRTYQRGLDVLYAGCAAQQSCAGDWGSLRRKVDQLTTRLERQPLQVPISPDVDGGARTVTFTAADLGRLLFSRMYLSGAVSLLPALIATAHAGDLTVLSFFLDRPAGSGEAPDPATVDSDGMFLSVVCSEEIAHGRISDLRAAARGTQRVIRKHWMPSEVEQYWEQCRTWNVDRADPAVLTPVESDTPALVVAGHFDPITPPGYAAAMASTLSGGRTLVMAGESHSPFETVGTCGNEILGPFLDDPTRPVDAPCAAQRRHFYTAAELEIDPAGEPAERGPALDRVLDGRFAGMMADRVAGLLPQPRPGRD